MRDIIDDIDRWLQQGVTPSAIATVLRTYGSAPRPVGGKLAIADDGRISGSISGGCVESAIIEAGCEIAPDAPPEILHFETSNELAWEVGLPCGGTIDVLLEPFDRRHYDFLSSAIRTDKRVFSITPIDGEEALRRLKASGTAGDPAAVATGPAGSELPPEALELASGADATGILQTAAGLQLFVEVFPPSPTLVMIGGVHIATALVKFARILGYRTVVVDPRKAFGTAERFPEADQLIREWPEEALSRLELTRETALVVLTHDPKLDDPALIRALKSPTGYIGALGSARTQAARRERLLEAGFSPAELARIHGPVGLEIDASTPEEIALSIIGEMVALSHNADGVLRESDFALGAPARS